MRKLYPFLIVVAVALYLAAPRPAADIPYGTPGASSTAQQRTGAPPTRPVHPVGTIPSETATPTPRPSVELGDWSCSEPPLCGETPQPRIVDGISGSITWYPRTRGYGDTATVALPDGHYIPAGRPVPYAVVCIVLDGNSRCATLPVVDCLCAGSSRIADLSLGAVRLLKLDPSTGIWHGTVERLP